MRMLRLSLAGTVILTLLGGMGSTVLAQDDDEEMVGATYVTGMTPGGFRTVSRGSMVGTDIGASFRGEIQEREVEWSDPRLPSSMRLSQNMDYYVVSGDWEEGPDPLDVPPETITGAISLAQNVRLDGPDGAWTGTIYGLIEETMAGSYPETVLMVLQGEGTYEGLSAMLKTTYEEAPTPGQVPDWVGYIFEDALTPVPEPPEPSIAE